MWLNIYNFIIKAQSSLGDGAEISLSARDGFLVVRVDLTIEDYHAISEIGEMSLVDRDEELVSRRVAAFVEWCRKKRDNTITATSGGQTAVTDPKRILQPALSQEDAQHLTQALRAFASAATAGAQDSALPQSKEA